jgi:hypothetical protein
MTDHDADVEHLEALLPGRNHLKNMALLADRMVFMFGVADPVDPSRTMMWRGEDRTYFLGYGSHWQELTGEPATHEKWLLALEDAPEDADKAYVPQSTVHLISERNDQLAGNNEQRQEVAAILRAAMATELVGILAEAFPATSYEEPGRATLVFNDAPYHFKVFSKAALPFAFVEVYGAKYELAADNTLEQADPTFIPHPDTPMPASLEQRLVHMTTVLTRGERRAHSRYFISQDEKIRDQELTPGDIASIEDAMQELRDYPYRSDLPEAIDHWQEEGADIFAYRTQAPRIFGAVPGAVGVVAHGSRLVVETLSLEGGASRRERIKINLDTGVATHVKLTKDATGFTNIDVRAGTRAALRAREIIDLVEAGVSDETLQPCPAHAAELFDDEILKLSPKEPDTVE